MKLEEEDIAKLLKLSNSIDSINIDETDGTTHIKFKNSVILESDENFTTVADGFIMAQGQQVHFNPMCSKVRFMKDLMESSNHEIKQKIINQTVKALNIDATEHQIEGIISGRIDINTLINADGLRQKILDQTTN